MAKKINLKAMKSIYRVMIEIIYCQKYWVSMFLKSRGP